MQRFLGIGECMVELSGDGPGRWRQSFAGDVFNTLWYARTALPEAWEVRFHTALGTDPISDEMALFIEDGGIRCDVPRIPDRRPGLYMIHLDQGERSFTYWRETSAARLLARDQKALKAATAKTEIIYFSGITLAILSPEDVDVLLAKIRKCRARGVITAFDPNIRPALWPDRDRMQDVITAGAKAATIVLPSHDDEKAAFGDADPAATADRYRKCGADLVVVKNGGGDLLLDWRGTRETFQFPQIDTPVDTTGAGDSFNGAFLGHYASSLNPGEAAIAGHACAARVIQQKGALIAL